MLSLCVNGTCTLCLERPGVYGGAEETVPTRALRLRRRHHELPGRVLVSTSGT